MIWSSIDLQAPFEYIGIGKVSNYEEVSLPVLKYLLYFSYCHKSTLF